MPHEIDAITAHPTFHAAQAALRADHERLVEEIILLTEIPAPPFREAQRAEAFRAMLEAAGLEDVRLDAVGNVTGVRRGRGNGQMIALAAHLDTVFPEGTDVRVRREGTRLHAPGVGDDTRGLAVLLAFARALDVAGVRTEADLLFVADVGEEGKGDLRGIRHLFGEGEYRDRIGAFFTFDSPDMEEVVTCGIGSLRYRLVFRGPGGHSFSGFGTVNPGHVMAEVVAGMARMEVGPQTTFCASVFGGGTSVNAIPEEVWVEIDLRSAAAEALAALEARVRAIVAEAVAVENGRGRGEVRAEFQVIGNRPAGRTDAGQHIVTHTLAALAAFGFQGRTGWSSTDANIPMSLGVPAIRIGTGGTGGGAHTLEEWIDVEEEASLRGLSAGLAAVLMTAGFVAGA